MVLNRISVLVLVSFIICQGNNVHAQSNGSSCNPFSTIKSQGKCDFGLLCSKTTRTCQYAQEGDPCIPRDTDESKTSNIPNESKVFCDRNRITALTCKSSGNTSYGQRELGTCVSTKNAPPSGPRTFTVGAGQECDLNTIAPIVPGELFVCSSGLSCQPVRPGSQEGKCAAGSAPIVAPSPLLSRLSFQPSLAPNPAPAPSPSASPTPTPTQDPLSSGTIEEFPECKGLGEFQEKLCLIRYFGRAEDHLTTLKDKCYSNSLLTNTEIYKANCTIGCPPDTLCSSFGGLCAEPSQEGQALPSFLNAKCERGQVCKKHVGTQRCLENASAARESCTCAENGGILMPPSQCDYQCGAPTAATDAPTGGSTLADVCCIPIFKCPDYNTYTCEDGSATYIASCLPNGDGFCEVGTLVVSSA